jgi:ABC-2 type transport system ATP-binding protein
MTTVDVKHLNKSYAGKMAVKDLSFSVSPGELLGLIGPNGAGKSSTIKIILDFLKPDSGVVRVFGSKMTEGSKDRIGYLPEEKGLYKRLSAIEQILYLASLKGMDSSLAKVRAEELLRKTDMWESRKKKIKEMSKGMGQMIQFIVTILHDPEVIILDEPFSGLDPINTELLKVLVGQLRDEGKTIILSTHQMNQVEELCDRVLMIHKGMEVLHGGLAEIKEKYTRHSVLVRIDGEIGELPGVADSKINRDSLELILKPDIEPQSILDHLRKQGKTIKQFEVTSPSLNEIFLDIAGADHE